MCALGLAAISPLKAAIVVNQGDLLLSFYQNDGTTAGANTYVYNLGAASTWLNNTNPFQSIVNLNADLTLAFGSGWASDPTLQMGIVGGFNSTNSSASDPARTIYYSQALTTYAPGSSTSPTFNSSQRGSLATNIGSNYLANMNGEDEGGATDGGAIVPTSNNNDYAQYQPPTAVTYFGVGTNPNTTFGAGNIGTGTGGYTVEAAVDLFRVLHSTSGADLTAGLSSGNATVGVGQYIGSFTIDSSGNVRLDAVPEPSTYALIATGLALLCYRFRKRRTA